MSIDSCMHLRKTNNILNYYVLILILIQSIKRLFSLWLDYIFERYFLLLLITTRCIIKSFIFSLLFVIVFLYITNDSFLIDSDNNSPWVNIKQIINSSTKRNISSLAEYIKQTSSSQGSPFTEKFDLIPKCILMHINNSIGRKHVCVSSNRGRGKGIRILTLVALPRLLHWKTTNKWAIKSNNNVLWSEPPSY